MSKRSILLRKQTQSKNTNNILWVGDWVAPVNVNETGFGEWGINSLFRHCIFGSHQQRAVPETGTQAGCVAFAVLIAARQGKSVTAEQDGYPSHHCSK